MSSDLVKSFSVGSTLAAQRGVCATTGTAWTVEYGAGAGEVPIGITVDTVIDASGAIPVQLNGIAKLLFDDTCVSGAYVALDSSGRGVPHADVTAGSYVIGTLVDAKVDATGTVAQVLINPHFKSIP